MQRRTGVTLLETLVAIFVMALGLLALLTLFPLGALNMAQAIKDDRAAQAAIDSDAIAAAWNIRQDADVQPALLQPDLFPLPPGQLVPQLLPTAWVGPSYPVYIDPVGWLQAGGASPMATAVGPGDTHALPPPPAAWVGSNMTLIDLRGMPYSGVPRRSLRFLNNQDPTMGGDPSLNPLANPFAAAYRYTELERWCTLLDDPTFNDLGQPVPTLDREGRYSWAYLARLSTTARPDLVELSVVVYSGRPLTLGPTGQPAGEHGYAATFTQGSKVVTLRWNPAQEEQPPIRKGTWIMDGTLVSPSPPTMIPDPHGYFYRVVNLTDLGTANNYRFLELELQHYARASTSTLADNQGFTPGYWGRLLVLENVVEVFDRGTGQ